MDLNSLTYYLDGITVQYAGELLFDPFNSTGHREQAKDTYIRCLEDFSFAFIYGTKFAVSGSLPDVGNESPGKILTNYYNDWLTDVELSVSKKPEELIKDKFIRDIIKEYIELLPLSYNRYHRYWNEFFQNETNFNLLETEEENGKEKQENYLEIELTQKDKYVFAKKPELIKDTELQNYISLSSFIEPIVNHLLLLPIAKKVNKTALVEFVSRATLTHIVIFIWYENIFAESKINFYRVPHITRSLLSLSFYKSKGQFIKDLLFKTSTRHALSKALEISTNRNDLVDVVLIH